MPDSRVHSAGECPVCVEPIVFLASLRDGKVFFACAAPDGFSIATSDQISAAGLLDRVVSNDVAASEPDFTHLPGFSRRA